MSNEISGNPIADQETKNVEEFEGWVDECKQIDKAYIDGSILEWIDRKCQSEIERFLTDYDRPTTGEVAKT